MQEEEEEMDSPDVLDYGEQFDEMERSRVRGGVVGVAVDETHLLTHSLTHPFCPVTIIPQRPWDLFLFVHTP